MERNEFIMENLKITPEQKTIFKEKNDVSLTNEQLEIIPDILDGYKLSEYQKKSFAMGERVDFLDTNDELKASFNLREDGKIYVFYSSGEEDYLKNSDVIRDAIVNQQPSVEDSKNLSYLKNQLKYLGFGDSANEPLEAAMTQGFETFQLEVQTKPTSPEIQDDVTMNYQLDFSKSKNSDYYFLNSYTAKLEGEQGKEQKFYINKGKGVTSKEAFNLLSGRSVNRNVVRKDGTEVNLWMELNKDEEGPAIRYYNKSSGFDLEAAMSTHPIKYTDNVKHSDIKKSLEKGNLQSVFLEKNGINEQVFISANPKAKELNVYDKDLNIIRAEVKRGRKPWEGGQEKPQKEGITR